MSVETISRIRCDRCKQIREVSEDEAAKVAAQANNPALYLEYRGEKTELGDLCQKCQDRVDALVTQIGLNKDDAPETNKVTKKDKEPKKQAKPKPDQSAKAEEDQGQ